jgi:gas vesicle protein
MNNDRVYYSHDAEMHAMRDRNVLTLVFLTFGLGIGAVLALLFAPSSGKKVRDNLAKNVGEGLNTGQEAIEPVVKRLEKEFGELRKSVEDRLKQS